MKVIRKSSFVNCKEPVDICSALQETFNGSGLWCDDAVSVLQSNVSNIAFSLGVLIQNLHESGVISEQVVLELLNYQYIKADE